MGDPVIMWAMRTPDDDYERGIFEHSEESAKIRFDEDNFMSWATAENLGYRFVKVEVREVSDG